MRSEIASHPLTSGNPSMNGGLASAAAFDADDPDELPVLEPDPVLPLVEPEELEDPVLELVDEPLEDVLELVPVLLLVVVLERDEVELPVLLLELLAVESLGTVIVTVTVLADSA